MLTTDVAPVAVTYLERWILGGGISSGPPGKTGPWFNLHSPLNGSRSHPDFALPHSPLKLSHPSWPTYLKIKYYRQFFFQVIRISLLILWVHNNCIVHYSRSPQDIWDFHVHFSNVNIPNWMREWRSIKHHLSLFLLGRAFKYCQHYYYILTGMGYRSTVWRLSYPRCSKQFPNLCNLPGVETGNRCVYLPFKRE